MEEDIKILEDYAYAMCTISSVTEKDQIIAKAIENLIKGYKELEEDNEMQEDTIKELRKKLTYSVYIPEIKKEYIPKSKVEEKIDVKIKQLKQIKSDSNDDTEKAIAEGMAVFLIFMKKELMEGK